VSPPLQAVNVPITERTLLSASSNIPAASGDMGILANHVPTVEALRPGLIEVIESAGTSKKFFGKRQTLQCTSDTIQGLMWTICWGWVVSAGFATVHANNSMTINAVEAYEMDKFSPEVCSWSYLGRPAGTNRCDYNATIPIFSLNDTSQPQHPIDTSIEIHKAVRAGLADAQRVIGSNATEQDKAEARVEVEVFEAIQAALAK
jgi:hypothetical protein